LADGLHLATRLSIIASILATTAGFCSSGMFEFSRLMHISTVSFSSVVLASRCGGGGGGGGRAMDVRPAREFTNNPWRT
jgi:hypothetical protein